MLHSTETLTGQIIRITFHNPENFFTVAKIKRPNHTQEITVVGTMPFVQSGLSVHLQGSWFIDPKHGKQFKVEKYSYELPQDPEGLIQFLSSGILPGVGEKTATKMVEYFGTGLLHVLDCEQDRLYELHSLGKKKVKQIIASWTQRSQFQELSYILLSWGITHKQATKILKKWGHQSVEVIKKNPYTLAKEIQGIGFQLADAIAKSLGFDMKSKERIKAAIEYFLWEKANEGHTAPPLDEFIDAAREKLEVPREEVKACMDELLEEGSVSVFVHKGSSLFHVQVQMLQNTEKAIAKEFQRLKEAPSAVRSFDVEKALTWAEEKTEITLHSEQRKACHMALSNPVSIITGGPGTGKSTIIRVLLTILGKLTPHMILAAPTGKAAKRMYEITHYPSQTIHRLLRFDPAKNSFKYNATNPLKTDVIIIDETSMLDTHLTNFLIRAIPSGAKVVLVGDVNQLPSIGPGAILKDLISSNTIPTTCLTEVFRQAKRSNIIQSAHRILQGEIPFLKNFPGSDFLFFAESEPLQAQATLLDLVTNKLPSTFGFDPQNDIQVLSPMKKGDVGCDALNHLLQSHFSKKDAPSGNLPFHLGDKVMQIKNNYNKDVYNGDVGRVERIDTDSRIIQVAFDDQSVEYQPYDLDELMLAWAISVHKYQGSEIPCVVVPVHTQHFKLLTRNLLYTAVTRGKKLVVLVGSVKAIAIAVKQTDSFSRWTGLSQKLEEALIHADNRASLC